MYKSKKARSNQQYENYWKLTLEYTDYTGEKFNKTLSLIVRFIDKHNGEITPKVYNELQEELYALTPKKDKASIRKAINQFLKLGFINNKMKSYHKKTKEFLKEENLERKKIIYSEILYDNASFNRSFKNDSNKRELNFLIKTLEKCGSISKEELLALMYKDIGKCKKGYIDSKELTVITKKIKEKKIYERKYNQVNYLWHLCSRVLSGIYLSKEGKLTLDKDEQVEESIRKGRDPYKQRLYKIDLYRESREKCNEVVCYCENIEYPTLIASHIKPYHKCDEDEKFDLDNGLLLSKNIDSLFDQGWITFEDDGSIVCSNNLDEKLKNVLRERSIDIKYLESKKRLEYLAYHRKYVFDIDKSPKEFAE